MNDNILGELLCEYGVITSERLSAAGSSLSGGKGLYDELLREGIQETKLLEALGNKLGLPVLPPQIPQADREAVSRLPRAILEKYRVLPLSVSANTMRIAVCDPLDSYALEDIRQITGMSLELCLCGRDTILSAVEHYCSDSDTSAQSAPSEQSTPSDGEDSSAVRLVEKLISRGCELGASDIHIEPFEEDSSVRMRIDGILVDFASVTSELHTKAIARIKVVSGLDIAERRLPQDGNIHAEVQGRPVNLRVSVMPTVYGEKAVLRFLDTEASVDNAESFGMDEASCQKLLEMLDAPHGLIYFTGPTGSGKTTTLYMILEQLAKKPVNICTIEDPVERRLPRVNQTAVNSAAGMDFGMGFRSILRQDPDIIMLGETRDYETAEISVRAAITGHLVLSTLHTSDAVSAVIRLEDMGIAPYLVSNSLLGVVAQRLLRKNCPHCSEELHATAAERDLLGASVRFIRRGKGCAHCNFTGYKGRTAIHEVLRIDKTLRGMISKGEGLDEMYSYACMKQGMRPLRSAAAELVVRGITTPEEVRRAAYFTD